MMTDDKSPGVKSGPQTVTVTTTRTTSTNPILNTDWIQLNKNYFRTLPGVFKICELVLGILCMALGSPAIHVLKGTDFFLFVVVVSFILTLLWAIIYFLSIRENLQSSIPWLSIEFYTTAGSAVMYFIAMVVQFATVTPYANLGSYVASAVFALFNTIAYAAGTFYLFREWKGLPVITTTTSPA